ncbi:MAG: PSD1 domain-containing protein [Planctomycetales bacterium]|nr:PSD1 domain-containing protein [Planctomycetales bacterium]
MRFAATLFALTVSFAASTAVGDEVRFNRDIRPLLSDRCFHCHGPNENDREASLRLDQADGLEGAHSSAIDPGSTENSELWSRISSDDPDIVMPPADSNKKPLSENEKAKVKRWIEQGAPYEDFWAFVPPAMPAIPRDVDMDPIDYFVHSRLESEGFKLSPRADNRTLIRRLTLDLTGLPPTRDEIHAYLADDSVDAYEKLVDRLLDSPHYGEHLAKYWLDLVRFADTNGIHHDHYREMSPYRDWVIRAFNDNLPYDQFTRYQLAGDLYPNATRDQLIASGFHRLHLIIDRGTALPEESFTRNVIDRVTSVGTAFMGMTVQCSVCHDHKYDPMTMKDFYSLAAFFNNIDAEPETGGRSGTDFTRGLQPPYIDLTDAEQDAELERLQSAAASASAELERLRAELKAAGDEEANKSAAEKAVKEAERNVKTAERTRDDFVVTIPAAMVMKERSEIRPAHILVRGAYDKPGEEVQRNAPAFLPPLTVAGDVATRMDLANWFVSREHPLTARVAVNRFWQQLFGVGLVRTAEDFGAQGEWPSHPELLDYLAVRFVNSGWDVKALLKEIAMSETYQQSSVATPEVYQRDPQNRLLARGSRFRMDSEMIRDQVLATSGLLVRKLYGKSVKPPQPEGLWTAVSMPSSYPRQFEPDSGDNVYRRSIYTFWKRGMPPPQMTILNAPTREDCTARRERTNTPLQALLLLNEAEYLKAARHLAAGILSQSADTTADQIDAIYETITSRLPSAEEREVFAKLVEDLRAFYSESPDKAEQVCGQEHMPADSSHADLAAWTLLTSTIYNLDITKTRQ